MSFDVLVWNVNEGRWKTVTSDISKREAKKLIKELRSKGKKAQLKTTIGVSAVDNCAEDMYDEDEEYAA